MVFEVGCGVGNFMFPLMSEDKNMYFYACDFSHRAVQFVKVGTSTPVTSPTELYSLLRWVLLCL